MVCKNLRTGPYDRGQADSYYRRAPRPHYYEGLLRIEEKDMRPEEIKAYDQGYADNEQYGDHKDYN
jgi:hypothetical protein